VTPRVSPSLAPRSRTAIRAVLAVLLTIAVTAASGCQRSEPTIYDYFRITVDGQQTLGVSKKDAVVRGVVIFFHGIDTNEFAMTADQAHTAVTNKLVNAGFAVIASQAGGNAFGNPKSQNNYRALAYAALQHYRVENVFFLAESMGALAAISLLAETESSRIRGLAAINPILDLGRPQFAPAIAESYTDQMEIDSANPMNLNPELFTGKRIRLYVSRDDSAVTAESVAFRDRFGSVADISIVECSGALGDPACLQGDDLLSWFALMERRTPQ
jgi:pimeloyl-ACP methyl ester carboxylesterase